jgi:hypothetical protein
MDREVRDQTDQFLHFWYIPKATAFIPLFWTIEMYLVKMLEEIYLFFIILSQVKEEDLILHCFLTHSFRSGRHASTTSDRLTSGLVPHQLLFPTASLSLSRRFGPTTDVLSDLQWYSQLDRENSQGKRCPTFQMPFVIIFFFFHCSFKTKDFCERG